MNEHFLGSGEVKGAGKLDSTSAGVAGSIGRQLYIGVL